MEMIIGLIGEGNPTSSLVNKGTKQGIFEVWHLCSRAYFFKELRLAK